MKSVRLITIPISHYCEKARWALERIDIAYIEERHLQGFHYPRTCWVSGNPNVPVLLDAGKVIVDSTAILRHLDRYASPAMRLYPENTEDLKQVGQLEDLFDEVLGVESRRWAYFHFLPDSDLARRICAQGVPRMESALFTVAYPFLRLFAAWLLRPTAGNVKAGLDQCRKIVQQVDGLLADGRQYLVGDKFSAADLSLACMMAPLVVPGEYGVGLPELDELPAEMRSVVLEFRGSPTGEFVLRLFREHRPQGKPVRVRGHKLPA